MRKLSLIILALAITYLPVNAQKNADNDIEKTIEKLRMAMVEGNREKLSAIASDNLTYGHSGGSVENKEEFIEKIVSGKSDFVTIDLTAQVIKVTGDVATVRHNLKAATSNNGVPGEANLHVLTVWLKQKGEWKLLARQAVKSGQ